MTGHPEVVLIPGMNCDESLWQKCTPLLEGSIHFLPRQSTLSDTITALDQCVQRSAVLVGLSLGAIVAMAYSRVHPQKTDGLLLMSSNASAPSDSQYEGWKATVSALTTGEMTPMEVQQNLGNKLLSEIAYRSPEMRQQATNTALGIDTATLINQLNTQSTRIDELPYLRSLNIPVEILCGDDDKLCPLERHFEMKSAIPKSGLTVIPGAGHLITLEQPEAVNDAFKRLVRRLESDQV